MLEVVFHCFYMEEDVMVDNTGEEINDGNNPILMDFIDVEIIRDVIEDVDGGYHRYGDAGVDNDVI